MIPMNDNSTAMIIASGGQGWTGNFEADRDMLPTLEWIPWCTTHVSENLCLVESCDFLQLVESIYWVPTVCT